MIKRILKQIGLFPIVKYIYNQIKIQLIFFKRKFNRDTSFCTQTTKRCIENKKSVNYKYQLFGEDSPVCCNTHLYEILRDVSTILIFIISTVWALDKLSEMIRKKFI